MNSRQNSIKRSLKFVLILGMVMVMGWGISAQASGPKLYLDVSGPNTPSEGLITVLLMLDTNESNNSQIVWAFLRYNTDLMSWDSGETNLDVFDNTMITGPPREQRPGIISFSAGANAALSGNGIEVVSLVFDVNDGVMQSLMAFDILQNMLEKSEVVDGNFDPVDDFLVEDGLYIPGQSPAALIAFEPPVGALDNSSGQVVCAVTITPYDSDITGFSAFITYPRKDGELVFADGTVNRTAFNNSMLTADPQEREDAVISFPANATSPLAVGVPVEVATLRFDSTVEQLLNINTIIKHEQRITEVYNENFDGKPYLAISGNYVLTADPPEPTPTVDPIDTPIPTNTPEPEPTDTPDPIATNTPVPVATETPTPSGDFTPSWRDADLNRDGVVDAQDLLWLMYYWHQSE